MLPRILTVPAAALHLTAASLRVAAAAADRVAVLLRPEEEPPAPPATVTAAAGQPPTAQAEPRPTSPPPAPRRPRRSPQRTARGGGVDLGTLVTGPARAVIDALDGLSTDELSTLHELEAAGRSRRSVLRAIEDAAAPPASAAAAEDSVTVYTTQTP